MIFDNDDTAACVEENICEADVVINDSDDLENINNCFVINGNLTIKNTELSNLEGLEKLYYVNGNLSIVNNTQLVSISALGDLQDIAGGAAASEIALVDGRHFPHPVGWVNRHVPHFERLGFRGCAAASCRRLVTCYSRHG